MVFKDKMYAIEAIGVERMAAGIPVVELDDEHSDDDLLCANIVELIRTMKDPA